MSKKKKTKPQYDAVEFGDPAGNMAIGGLRAPVVAIALTNDRISTGGRGIILALSVNEETRPDGLPVHGGGKGEMPWYVHAMDAEGARTVAASLLAHATMAEVDGQPETPPEPPPQTDPIAYL